ncbi:MAG: nucleotidyltransferase [Lentisphaerae bacterium RIFOXYB12_FULL_65_16]|nr:MAG: nucleotidyltransferase [Lentisphaerae bacterium RIFOXYA12_64_32]OGV91306.1 MAG: nucleotidyltransferase [Lentisphaerae bacterium RIFOXYB12_FULL_65_16]
MATPTLLVLAAGIGSRYGGFKQIDPVGPNGEIVLDYTVYDAWKSGFGKVVFVISPTLDATFRQHFDTCLPGRMQVDYVFQRMDDLPPGFSVPKDRQKPWGTGHAIWSARNAIREPFGAVNADDFYGRGAYQTLADFLKARSAADKLPTYCMVAYRLANTLTPHGTVARGICTADGRGFLSTVVERTKIEAVAGGSARFQDADGSWTPLTGNEPASMNYWGFTPSLFDRLSSEFTEFLKTRGAELKSEFFIPTVVDTLIKRGQCQCAVLSTDEKWFGMTYREDRPKVTESIRALIGAGLYPEKLWG